MFITYAWTASACLCAAETFRVAFGACATLVAFPLADVLRFAHTRWLISISISISVSGLVRLVSIFAWFVIVVISWLTIVVFARWFILIVSWFAIIVLARWFMTVTRWLVIRRVVVVGICIMLVYWIWCIYNTIQNTQRAC